MPCSASEFWKNGERSSAIPNSKLQRSLLANSLPVSFEYSAERLLTLQAGIERVVRLQR